VKTSVVATEMRETVQNWFRTNTFTPSWFPKSWRHPAVAYGAAVLVQIVAILLTMGILQLVPDFSFRGAIILLGVILVALTVGGAPGLLASLMGTLLLDVFVIPPTFSLALKKGADLVTVVFYLIVCLATNLAASSAERRNTLRKEA
jgi:two-component system, OmpR family, sensor histidine kinase KdpD